MTADRTRTLLVAAHDRLTARATVHTTQTLARDKDGNKVKPSSPYAVKFCSLGLLLNARQVDSLDHPDVFPATQMLRLAAVEQGFMAVSVCNDLHGRTGALRMLARSIELIDTEPFAALLERAETARPETTPLTLVGEKGTS